jgi:hypothetical protein
LHGLQIEKLQKIFHFISKCLLRLLVRCTPHSCLPILIFNVLYCICLMIRQFFHGFLFACRCKQRIRCFCRKFYLTDSFILPRKSYKKVTFELPFLMNDFIYNKHSAVYLFYGLQMPSLLALPASHLLLYVLYVNTVLFMKYI